ncbi:hypothetical protein BD311DRAFT_760479 [Dichomitus squalens]|uniref:Uncharacterized protein n=1 Tax=Dichomitus squalens TaxID=114155 RepID=A0A4Q9MJA0_9APHY|nr:hypothetical protein BD311DRAFT_760479 [Dichomitus squalens]
MKLTLASFLAIFAVAGFAHGQTLDFFTVKSCSGAVSEEFRDVGCNVCVDPPGDWEAVSITDIGSNQRWESHNENGCTAASLVGQGFGPACDIAGHTAIRSFFVAC